jgi:hypothetical protein
LLHEAEVNSSRIKIRPPLPHTSGTEADTGFVSSTSSVLTNLIQTLGTESPTLASVFSSPNVQSALQTASPEDVVQLSDDAVQFQEASLLFGNATEKPTSDDASDSILQSLESSFAIQSGVVSSTAAGATAPATDSQARDLASLFGTTTTASPALNTFI